MPNDVATREFWERCRELRPAWRDPTFATPEAWGFGDGPDMADRLGALVVSGVKTATCGALWEYEHEKSPLPDMGELGIVLDGKGAPLCLIETTNVTILPFDEVPADFAYAEGEGDRTLANWREAHWDFFSRFLPTIGIEPARDMPLVCERFRVLSIA